MGVPSSIAAALNMTLGGPVDVRRTMTGQIPGIPITQLMSLEIPENVLLEWEWVEEAKGYREFLIPAEVVNRYGPPTIVDDDLDRMKAWRDAGG